MASPAVGVGGGDVRRV
ncbi:hypothetical protein A2U01_0107773, partial [Trifolium medium]|nr:hypothetical protein [Trifolium medium]